MLRLLLSEVIPLSFYEFQCLACAVLQLQDAVVKAGLHIGYFNLEAARVDDSLGNLLSGSKVDAVIRYGNARLDLQFVRCRIGIKPDIALVRSVLHSGSFPFQ